MYTQLPEYMQLFDICCVYYKLSDVFNNYRNPKKLMEYLATGKAVVSVDLLQIREFKNCIYIAHNYKEFDALLSCALWEDSPEVQARRISVAQAHTWEAIADQAGEMIMEILK